MVVEHIVNLTGKTFSEGHPVPEAAGNVLRLIQHMAIDATSMGFRHASRLRGRRPDWLVQASDIRFASLSAGPKNSTNLHFVAPRFGEAAPDIYRQGEFFSLRPKPEDTAFDLVGDALFDVEQEVRDSDRFDSGLLRRIESFKRTADDGISLSLYGDRLPQARPARLDSKVIELATALDKQIPLSKRSRIAGKLDMIRDSDKVFILILDDGTRVRGVWTGEDMNPLSENFGKYVVAEGQAVFRPSGSLLRLEAEAIRVSVEEDRFFSKLPLGTSEITFAQQIKRPQMESSGASAVFGRWPGDETEEEILTALREMR